jgi:hypothetical protein
MDSFGEGGHSKVEAERQPGGDPRSLLQRLQGKVSPRKLRLFSLACLRRFECFEV